MMTPPSPGRQTRRPPAPPRAQCSFVGQSALLEQSCRLPAGHEAWHDAPAPPPPSRPPPNCAQHTSPLEHCWPLVHASEIPMHEDGALQVAPPPPKQQTSLV